MHGNTASLRRLSCSVIHPSTFELIFFLLRTGLVQPQKMTFFFFFDPVDFFAKKKKKVLTFTTLKYLEKWYEKRRKTLFLLKIWGQPSADVFPISISKILWAQKVPIIRPRSERDPLK